MQRRGPGVDANCVADLEVIIDGGFETLDKRPQAEAAGREQSVEIGARRVRDLLPLQRKVGKRDPCDFGLAGKSGSGHPWAILASAARASPTIRAGTPTTI